MDMQLFFLEKFKAESKLIYPLLYKEMGIKLDFTGLTSIIEESSYIEELGIDELFIFIKEINAWINYLTDISCCVERLMNSSLNKLEYLYAFQLDNKPNRQLEDWIENQMLECDAIKNYYNTLISQKKLFVSSERNSSLLFKESLSKFNR